MSQTPENLKQFEEKLRDRHAEILGEMKRHDEIIHEAVPQDQEEASNVKGEIDVRHAADRLENSELELIQNALDRIKKGAYGTCEECGKTIPTERLEARPYSRFCVPCQEKSEKK